MTDRSSLLFQLAQSVGIETEYTSMTGLPQRAHPAVLAQILQFWGYNSSPDQPPEDWVQNQSLQTPLLPPVAIAWDHRKASIPIRWPVGQHLPKKVLVTVQFENGHSERHFLIPSTQSSSRSHSYHSVGHFQFRPEYFGYYHIQIDAPGGPHDCLLISAPTKAFSPPEAQRQWGCFLPLYAAHSDQSWGAGNLSDWRRLAQWAGALGASFLGTLPMLSTFLEPPVSDPSPYSPVSRLFWNEFFIDITRIPELAECAPALRLVNNQSFLRNISRLRRQPTVEYQKEMALKRQVLELLAECFFSNRGARTIAFERYSKTHPDLNTYAAFRATLEQQAKPWRTWPSHLRNGRWKSSDFSEDAFAYHSYVQWIAQEQFQEAFLLSRGAGVDLYLDLPVGVHPDGYDAWRHRNLFVSGASVGAPPDAFFTRGQNWGFPPLHPQRLRDDQYRYVIQYLQFQMKNARLLRIDHVMGLHRLYWIPTGAPPSDGAYVRYPADELYAILTLESHRHQTVLIGENLGTVPAAVNTAMTRHQLRQMYVVQYSQQSNPDQPLPIPPTRSIATMNTHDMPTFAAHWQGLDIDDRLDLKLLSPRQAHAERHHRKLLRQSLQQFLRRHKFLKSRHPSHADVFQAVIAWLASSPAEFVQVNLEDLWGEILPQNVPGTTHERVNWRRKTRLTLDALFTEPVVLGAIRQIKARRQKPLALLRRPASRPANLTPAQNKK